MVAAPAAVSRLARPVTGPCAEPASVGGEPRELDGDTASGEPTALREADRPAVTVRSNLDQPSGDEPLGRFRVEDARDIGCSHRLVEAKSEQKSLARARRVVDGLVLARRLVPGPKRRHVRGEARTILATDTGDGRDGTDPDPEVV